MDNVAEYSREKFDSVLEGAYQAMMTGRSTPAKEAHARFLSRHGEKIAPKPKKKSLLEVLRSCPADEELYEYLSSRKRTTENDSRVER